MKVAVIGDIHANLPALRAVLSHARRHTTEAIWNVGDLIGYGPFPNEVLDKLRELEALSVSGEFDMRVLKFKEKEAEWRKKKAPDTVKALEWAYKTLTPKNRKYLLGLNRKVRLEVEGYKVLLVHGSPDSPKESLDEQTSKARLRKLADMAHADLILCGRAHAPFARQVEGIWFVNPGSVGQPTDGDPRASYALLTLAEEEITVRHYRVAYNIDRAVAALHRLKLPEAFAQTLLAGRRLPRK